MNIVAHNLVAMNAQRQYKIGTNARAKSTEKLSSGYKINRSADDAAGLAISEKMRRQIRGLNQASENIQDGVSFCQVADGALEEAHSLMHRITELAVKAANETYTDDDREMIDEELQHLKSELRRTFRDTEFNEIKIFRMPYVPEVTGQPDDIQVFNVAANDWGAKYGGIEVNDVRYTWAEMGVGLEADGVTFTGGTYEFTTWDNERLVIETRRGEQIPNVHRNYTWSASSQGVSVNGKFAATWADMGMDPNHVQQGTYSFDYHGMNISFEVDGDSPIIGDVIDGINGNNGLDNVSWETVYGYTVEQKAVDIKTIQQDFTITNTNKEHLLADGLALCATDTHVELVSNKVHDYTTKRWEDFSAANGDYPIVDWGLDKDGNTKSDETFDDSVEYEYNDAKTGFKVEFNLADEASLQAVKEGMNVEVFRALEAPAIQTDMALDDPANDEIDVQLGLDIPAMSFRFQDMLGRNWNADEVTFNTTMGIAEDANGDYAVSVTLSVVNGNSETFTETISKADFENALENGTQMNISLKSAHTLGIPADDVMDADVVGDPLESINFTIKTAKYSGTGTVADHITNMTTKVKNEFAHSTATVKSVGKATMKMHVAEKMNYSYETNFSVKVNPPKKQLNIQAGTEARTYIEMIWSPLNLSILGLGQAHVQTQSAAEEAIRATKKAVEIISQERSDFGAYQNRMERAQKNVENISENTQAAESVIRDADMAEELVKHSQQNILAQAGQAMMAQANMSNQGVLGLLG